MLWGLWPRVVQHAGTESGGPNQGQRRPPCAIHPIGSMSRSGEKYVVEYCATRELPTLTDDDRSSHSV